MKAIVCKRYGSPKVLKLTEIAKPAPQDDDVLIKIHAASINARDGRMLRANPFFIRLMPGGFFHPRSRILGADAAGIVEAVGRNVRRYKPGDQVFGWLPSAAGRGTFAEYVCAAENAIAPKPANLTYAQAAAAPLAALTALQALRDHGHIESGQRVLIHGASGGVGTFAIQIATAFGAEVTGVCSARNLELACSLGARHVFDYRREDFARQGKRYDLILAVNGFRPLSDYLNALSPKGSYVAVGGSMMQLIQAAYARRAASRNGEQKISIASLGQNQEDLIFLKELLEAGKIAPVIDGCYPLEKTPEAFWYFEKHPKGKVVIMMDE